MANPALDIFGSIIIFICIVILFCIIGYYIIYGIVYGILYLIYGPEEKKEKTPALVQIQNDMNNNPNNIQTSETKPHTDTYKFGDSNNGGFSSTTYYGNGNNGGFKSSTTYYSIQ